jgi:cytosine permease
MSMPSATAIAMGVFRQCSCRPQTFSLTAPAMKLEGEDMTTSAADVEHIGGLELEAEFEHEPVPLTHRKPLLPVAAVWFGFPMILTCAVFGGVITAVLGFRTGVEAILVGNAVLAIYVGSLSYLGGKTGRNFALIATRVWGRYGYAIAAGFLATIVIGWFAFQTGLTGATIHQSFGWSEKLVILLAGVLYIAVTFVGIRALSILGAIAAPLFVVLGIVAIVFVGEKHNVGGIWHYHGAGSGAAAFSFGAAVTLVIATFIDSGTMTADFTRWSRNGRQGVLAAFSAFPVANLVAFLVGAVVVASGAIGNPRTAGGNFLPIISHGHGEFLTVLAFLFVFINLGSVCTHCLYNGAVGWSHIIGSRMRLLTIVLGVIGTMAALAGVWNHFLDWLNVLGIFVPPIGAVIITDQLMIRRAAANEEEPPIRIAAFVGYAIGALAAGIVHYRAPQYADAVVGMLAGGLGYWLVNKATRYLGVSRGGSEDQVQPTVH